MKRFDCICECRHWNHRHYEGMANDQNFIKCHDCDCDDFRPDEAMMKDLKDEAKQLRYDAERGK